MPLASADVSKALSLIQKAPRVRVLCHRNPDGDAIGALLGAGLMVEKAFPEKQISFHCKDPVPASFHFLPAAFRVEGPPALQKGDAVIIVDCATPKMTEMHESHPELFDKTYPVINVDHHRDNPLYGTVNLVVPTAASACEILVEIADGFGWKMSGDIATCLLTGVYTDTGGLLHNSTTAHVYRTVARLLREGARQQAIVKAVYRNQKLSTLRLWGRVLEKISVTAEGGAISAVTEGDFRATGADYSELTGAIDYVNAVPGMRFSMVLSERSGLVKGSIRTLRDDVDVAEMAGKFQGGGHKRAAGFALPGKLKPEVRWKVIEESRKEPSAPGDT
ncbi:bifunctional oligoribonuclease/PAP phosphatase NrnA [Candidatus Peregrinibacteria bacterium]|nr:bifunctional oligoribonuclease/PAP phosphatase NrnA [Candidatus Peregrinibacteria bacterium]